MEKITEKDLDELIEHVKSIATQPENYDPTKALTKSFVDHADKIISILVSNHMMRNGNPNDLPLSLYVTGFALGRYFEHRKQQTRELTNLFEKEL